MESFYDDILRLQRQHHPPPPPQPLPTEVLDVSTLFLYHVWIDDYKSHPVVADMLSAGAPTSRIMLLLYSLERAKWADERSAMCAKLQQTMSELEKCKAVCVEKEEALKRLAPIDRIVKENEMHRESVMEIGKHNIELERQLQCQLTVIGTKFSEESDVRRKRGHDIINTSHFELMNGLVIVPTIDVVGMRELWIKHMETVRLVLENMI